MFAATEKLHTLFQAFTVEIQLECLIFFCNKLHTVCSVNYFRIVLCSIFSFFAKPEMFLLSDNQKPAAIASMVLSLPGEDKICLRQSTIVNLPSVNLPLLYEGLNYH